MLKWLKVWNIWHKRNMNNWVHHILVLFGFVKSPTFEIEFLMYQDNKKSKTRRIKMSRQKLNFLNLETKGYAKTILAAPNAKRVGIYTFDAKEDAQKKSDKLKSWPYKVIVKARDAKGKFTKGYALICCK